MNILNHDGLISHHEVFHLRQCFEQLLENDFYKWIKDFNLIEWTEKLSGLSSLDLTEGFKNFQIYRNRILNSSAVPFPINCNKFKEYCYGLNMDSHLDKCGQSATAMTKQINAST